MNYKLLIFKLAYARSYLSCKVLNYKGIYQFSFILTSVSTEKNPPDVYRKEFILKTIFKGRIIYKKYVYIYCTKYVWDFQGAIARCVL